METCIRDVKHWMTSNKLTLNDDETKFIVRASRHLFKKAAVNTIRVGDCDVSKGTVVRNLGAWFDDQLTMAVPKYAVLLSITCPTLDANFKILLLTFKAIHRLALSYIGDLVRINPLKF